MFGAYEECYNLTGTVVCGNHVTNMSSAYYNCTNLTTAYIYTDWGGLYHCFYGKNTRRRLNIYLYGGTNTDNLFRNKSSSVFGHYTNLVWTNMTNGYYNTSYNVYVYTNLAD